MASAVAEPRAVRGRLDGSGRLIEADPELEALQREAGSEIGQALALPQIAAVAQLARKLGTPVGRPAIAASADSDIGLWVTATPEEDEVALSLEGWTVRPLRVRSSRRSSAAEPMSRRAAENEWATDEELRVISALVRARQSARRRSRRSGRRAAHANSFGWRKTRAGNAADQRTGAPPQLRKPARPRPHGRRSRNQPER